MSRHLSVGVRALAGALGALTLFLAGGAASTILAPGAPESAGVRTLGSPKAPVTVVEYASVGCPHCAAWANTVFPEFKKQFIDTGKVRFVFHEMLTGDMDLAAAGFLLADCAAPDRYFEVVDSIFADQAGIVRGGGAALFKIAQDAGMTRDQFQACLTDEQALKALQDRTDRDASEHGVTVTPTFIIGDEKLNGDIGLDGLAAAISRARP